MVLKSDHIGQTCLLPLNIKDVIFKDHVCFFVRGIVDCIHFADIDNKYHFTAGNRAYPRKMLLRAVLLVTIYEVYSSCKIEKLTNCFYVSCWYGTTWSCYFFKI